MDLGVVSVLLVDHEDSFRSVAAGMLGALGVRDIAQAPGPSAALEILDHRPFDVLLTELRLETSDGRGGFGFVEAAKTKAPRMSTLLMSAFATARDVEASRDLGIVEVLNKPFTSERLAQALDKAVAATQGLWGEVQQLTLLDMLQMYHYGRRSMAVHLVGEVAGRIFVRNGDIVHATVGSLRGLPALCRLLRVTSGVLRTAALPPYVEASIFGDFEAVVLEALRLLDEEECARASSDFDVELAERRIESTFVEAKTLRRTGSPAEFQELLQTLGTLDGYLGSCVADAASAEVITSHGGYGVDLLAASGCSIDMVRSELLTMKAFGVDDTLDDILISFGRQYHLIQPVAQREGLFVYLVLDKARSNLALGRYLLASVVAEIGPYPN